MPPSPATAISAESAIRGSSSSCAITSFSSGLFLNMHTPSAGYECKLALVPTARENDRDDLPYVWVRSTRVAGSARPLSAEQRSDRTDRDRHDHGSEHVRGQSVSQR